MLDILTIIIKSRLRFIKKIKTLYLIQSFIYLNTYFISLKLVVILNSLDNKFSISINILLFFLIKRELLSKNNNVLNINRVAFSIKTTRFNRLTCAKR